MKKITLCDMLGHKFSSEENREHGWCSRCNNEPSYLDIAEANGDRPWWSWLLPPTLWDTVKQTVSKLRCRVSGHDLVDEGHASPESGCVDLVCRRCGWSAGRVWLY